MATCGPNNALTNMKAYTERDPTLQRERATLQQENTRRAFTSNGQRHAEADFASFNAKSAAGFANDLRSGHSPHLFAEVSNTSFISPHTNTPASASVGYIGQRPALTPEPQIRNDGPWQQTPNPQTPGNLDWAVEFQQLSLHEGQRPVYAAAHAPQYNAPAAVSGTFNAFGQPQLYNRFNSQFLSHTQQFQNTSSLESDAFAEAFAEAEASLKRLQSAANQETHSKVHSETHSDTHSETCSETCSETRSETHLETRSEAHSETHSEVQLEEAAAAGDSVTEVQNLKDAEAHKQRQLDDVSAVAENIINTINERKDEELAKKVQGSKFMTLMSKLKNNQVKIDSNDLVDAHDNSKIDPSELVADAEVDHVLQTVNAANSANDWAPQRPINREWPGTHEQPPLAHEAHPKRKYRFSRDLDDPDTYLLKLRQNLDPRLFAKSPYESPFAAAEELAPQAVNKSGLWEETYENW